MAIISTIGTTASVTPDLTVAVAGQKRALDTQFQTLYRMFTNIKAFVWNNPNFTPQAVFDAYGTDAVELVRLADGVCAMLSVITETTVTVVPAGKTLTKNEDGTITVNG